MNYTEKILHQSNYWYNDGLRKAQIRDMSGAITSLRKSLQYNRANIDARNLLGLVYYGRGEVAEGLVEWIISKNLKPKARQILKTARKLDTTNDITLRYMHELSLIGGQKTTKKSREESVEYKLGNETIIQPAHGKRVRQISGKVTAGNIFAGVLIGAAIVWFLIVPSGESDDGIQPV